MKTLFAVVVTSLVLGFSGASYAGDEPAAEAKADKPDCSEKKTAVDDAKKAVKEVQKADLSSCADKKGKEKAECVKPLKEAVVAAKKEAQEKVKTAKQELKCCKKPTAKGCS